MKLVLVIAWFVVIFGINTTSDISKLLYVISRPVRRLKFETIFPVFPYPDINTRGVGRILKPSISSRLCITVSNSPNPSCVYQAMQTRKTFSIAEVNYSRKQFYCTDPQHGRLVTCLQTKNIHMVTWYQWRRRGCHQSPSGDCSDD